jgi:hypothetical protein
MRKSGRSLKSVFILNGCLLLILLLAAVNTFVWIPDLFRNEIVLKQVQTPEGDTLKLTQKFVGDGYLTKFIHTNKSGRAWEVVIDGDAFKTWRGAIELTGPERVSVAILKKKFVYDLLSHEVIDGTGRQSFVMELPEDGSRPHFVGGP